MTTLKHYWHEYGRMYFFVIVIFLLITFFSWIIFFSDILKNFLLWLEHFVQNKKEYVYLIAFLAAVAEGTIILGIIPGTTYIITLGVFWSRGDIDPFILFPVVILGAFLGDLLGYAFGSFSSVFLKKKYKNNSHYILSRKFINKHGAKSIFLARFISGIKEIVPFVAGILNMKFKKFIFWNFLGAIGWSSLWIGIGYTSGSLVKEIESIVRYVGLAFLTFFLISAYVFYKKNKNSLILHDEK